MTRGFIAGAFDVIHPGYIAMFKEAKQFCEYLIVGLHIDPQTNNKPVPVLSVEDRVEILNSIRYIDEVIPYRGEDGLVNLLTHLTPDIRFLGDDYKNKPITGFTLSRTIHYLDRSHGWSTTNFKQKIKQSIL